MVAEFNNDTSVIPTIVALYLSYNGIVEIAEPNFYLQPFSTTPCDPEYAAFPTRQSSLNMIGMPTVWPFTVGDPSIKVAVVDHGVDYWRCDLGGAIGNGNKVIDGWDYCGYTDPCLSMLIVPSTQGIFHNSSHGTAVASIIGALTDNSDCDAISGHPHGMAGIAGGRGAACGDPTLGTGVSIVGFYCATQATDPSPIDMAFSTSAILESAAKSTGGFYGFGVNVINLSLGGPAAAMSSVSHNAMTAAYLEGVSIVASSGDFTTSTISGPAGFDPPSEIIDVGASDHNMARGNSSNFDAGHVDLLAPGPDIGTDHIVGSLVYDGADCLAGPSATPDQFTWFWETSAAAPHVTGVASLLWGFLPTIGITSFFPEDIEGMLKASALDIGPTNHLSVDPNDGALYKDGYDDHTGWGFLKADKLFTMIDPAGTDAYTLKHIEATAHNMDTTAAFSTSFQTVRIISPILRSTATGHGGPGPDVLAMTAVTTTFSTHIREITGHASYAGLGISTTKPVYVWGNGEGKRGIANTNWNFSEPWCEVVPSDGNASGTYGSGNGIVTGIEHSSSTTVNLHSFQFELFDAVSGAFLKRFPSNDQLGLGFSVFGATIGTSDVQSPNEGTGGLKLWPTIASSGITIESDKNISRLIIIDILGRTVLEKNYRAGDMELIEIPTTDLVSGSYIARVFSGKEYEQCNFIVKH